MNFADRLQAIWYGGAPIPYWLRALVPVYRSLRAVSLLPYRLGWRKPEHVAVPVIVVGNLTAGGSGKTPLVLALIDGLRERGWNAGVISRGYGGSATTPTRVDAGSAAGVVGDEPLLIRQRSGAAVAIARRRVDAAHLLLASAQMPSIDVLIADDGLQHIALARDIEIAVIDGERRFGNGRLLPAGPLREPLARLATLDFRICNGATAAAGELSMRLVADAVIAVNDPSRRHALSDFAGQRVHAIAGIGNPDRYFRQLRDAGIDVIAHPFPDHHAYAARDILFDDGLPVLMTEKDAVKCRSFATERHHYLAVTAQLPDGFFDDVLHRLTLARDRIGSGHRITQQAIGHDSRD